MPEEAEIKIIDVAQIPVTSGERAGELDYIFTVQLPNGRVYFVRIPSSEINLKDEEMTKKVLESYLREQIGDILKWIGKSIKISL